MAERTDPGNYMIAIANGMVYQGGKFSPLNLYICNGIIEGFSSWGKIKDSYSVVDASGKMVVPGFIDIHIHGRNYNDVMNIINDKDVVEKIALETGKTGVTSFLPTVLTVDFDAYLGVIKELVSYMERQRSDIPQALGIYSEGVFFNPKTSGAQSPSFLDNPSLNNIEKIRNASKGRLQILALAPELDGAVEAAKFLRSAGVSVSMAHSDASYEEALALYNAGMRGATHFMNAMRPMHHLEPSLVGLGMLYDDITVELIVDGMHIRPEIVKLLFNIKPLDSIILITDNVWISGTPQGDYFLGEVPVRNEGNRLVVKGGKTFSLAGSAVTLDTALKNAVSFSGKALEDVLKCVTENPARYIGVDKHKGKLLEGYDADIVLLDGKLNVEETYVRGKRVNMKEI